jgi:hypothetical protein
MLLEFLRSIAGTAIGTEVSTNVWMFPTLEALHFVGLAILIGGIGAFDLRVLGVGRSMPIGTLHRLLPIVFIGFAINLITGVLFFLSDPVGYGINPSFQAKMVMVLLAGANAWWFERSFGDEVRGWGPDYEAPARAKLLCAISLVLWAGVITTGRLLPSFGALL